MHCHTFDFIVIVNIYSKFFQFFSGSPSFIFMFSSLNVFKTCMLGISVTIHCLYYPSMIICKTDTLRKFVLELVIVAIFFNTYHF